MGAYTEIKKNLKPNLDTDQRSLLYLFIFFFLKFCEGEITIGTWKKKRKIQIFLRKLYGEGKGIHMGSKRSIFIFYQI